VSVLEILESLRGLGISVQVVGPDRLRLQPASRIPAELVSRIREAKPEILEAIRNRPANCAASCYEVEPGRWIHHPWDGCTNTTGATVEAQVEETTCWHCGAPPGEIGICGCSTCHDGAFGECRVCLNGLPAS